MYDRRPYRASYRITWRQAGQRISRERASLPEARQLAEKAVRGLAAGLCTRPSQKDLEALKTAQRALAELGLSLRQAIDEYVAAKRILPQGTLGEAAEFYVQSQTKRNPTSFASAAEAFLLQQRKSVSARSYQEECLRVARLQSSFELTLEELTKQHIEDFFSQVLDTHSAKTRNHYRQTFRQLLGLAVRKDYLRPDHRLLEALRNERTHEAAPKILQPEQWSLLLKHAPPQLLPYVAIGGFAGLRRAEILRLQWQDVWGIEADEENPHGYIEVAASKAKTRQRRLVPIQPALKAWLLPYQKEQGAIWKGKDTAQRNAYERLKTQCQIEGSNLLRHSFASYRLATTTNAATVALELGTGEEKLFRNYHKLVARKRALAWFNTLP